MIGVKYEMNFDGEKVNKNTDPVKRISISDDEIQVGLYTDDVSMTGIHTL